MSDKFRVPLQEAGESCHLDFDIPAMEELQDFYGADYVQRVTVGLDQRNIATLRKALSVMMKGGNIDADAVIAKMPLAELAERIADAIYKRVYGRTLAELTQDTGES